MQEWLTRKWYAAHARPSLLQPLGWLYGGLLQLRRFAYAHGWLATRRPAAPVVVVGNLTVGGTGKTPLTLWLAAALGGRGLKVGILSRGYGRAGDQLQVVRADSDWRQVGDEPLLLARRSGCATVVARDRAAGAAALATLGVDVIVSDDGLQHLALARDCQIVVVDGARGFGNGRLLPAGPLREPLGRLAEVDFVVVNGPAEHPSVQLLPAQRTLAIQLSGDAYLPVDAGGLARPLAQLRGQRVHAVAGIGNPQRFFAGLRRHGLELIEHPFPDHHPFSARELQFADDLPVLMTEKDAVKCAAFASAKLWYVPVTAQLSEPDAQRLLDGVLARINSRTAARSQN